MAGNKKLRQQLIKQPFVANDQLYCNTFEQSHLQNRRCTDRLSGGKTFDSCSQCTLVDGLEPGGELWYKLEVRLGPLRRLLPVRNPKHFALGLPGESSEVTTSFLSSSARQGWNMLRAGASGGRSSQLFARYHPNLHSCVDRVCPFARPSSQHQVSHGEP